jgi:phosphate transport system protein
MPVEHTVRSFDEKLNQLDNAIAEMGGLAEHQLARAIDALLRRDADRAALVTASDAGIDRREQEVDQHAIALLALRQPMAADLRTVISALKTAAIIERIGDYAKNVAKRTAALAEMPPVPPATTVVRLGGLVQAMLKDVLDAYATRDVEKAEQIRDRDAEVDALYTSLFRELLTYMMEDPRNITACTHLMFIAKNLERVGDHATNIAENLLFMVRGRYTLNDRPKGDETSYTVLSPKTDQPPGAP